MTEIELMDETERQQFNEYKKKLNRQAAEAQISKLEYELTDAAVEKGTLRRACQDAATLGLGAICVLPGLVRPCVSFLGKDPKTSLIACISFPHGGDSTKTKKAAVKNAIKDGADEVEVSAPVAYVKDGNWSYVKREFKKLKSAAKKFSVRINVECDLLTPQELAKICSIAADCGITSVRSCSGAFGGRFDADVILRMKNSVKDKCTIKADGISSVMEMESAVNMGASIIGSKNAADIARLILKTAE